MYKQIFRKVYLVNMKRCHVSHTYKYVYKFIIFLVNKEVFVKHEQAPTAPKLGVWVFVDFKYIFYENRYFWPIYNFRSGVFDRNSQKAHLRTKTFHLSL